MPYDERLAERIRAVLAGRDDVVEQKMFGGIAFMVAGHMACGPHHDSLIVRIGKEAAAEHIGRPHVKPMDFTGRVLSTFAMIEPDGIRTEAQLRRWVTMAAAHAESQPPKHRTRKTGPSTRRDRPSSETSRA